MPLQTAMLLLRSCMVPALNYHLRCVAPLCIDDEARLFDQRMLTAAMDKLGLDEAERTERTATLLQRKLRDGGWGLTSAVQASPAAFLGSLAACTTEPSFAPYCDADTPLPASTQLHGWLDDSMQRVRRAAEGDQYRADIEPLLPATAGAFFAHYTTHDSTSTALQRTLNAKANQSTLQAAVQRMKEQVRRGEKDEWAHHKAITADAAWGWKLVRPEAPDLRLSDVEYAIAARLSLALSPFPTVAMAVLPDTCYLCAHSVKGAPISLRGEPWHFLSCRMMTNGELSRRHDSVADAIGRVAWLVGAQVRREVKQLDPHSNQRPDLQITFPGRTLLTDVAVSHSLTPNYIAQSRSSAAIQQLRKREKYRRVASRLGAELLNASVEASGGLASDAERLMHAIGEEGERWSVGTWTSGAIRRQLLGAIAVAVQRGNALAMLSGYTRVTSARVGLDRRHKGDEQQCVGVGEACERDRHQDGRGEGEE